MGEITPNQLKAIYETNWRQYADQISGGDLSLDPRLGGGDVMVLSIEMAVKRAEIAALAIVNTTPADERLINTRNEILRRRLGAVWEEYHLMFGVGKTTEPPATGLDMGVLDIDASGERFVNGMYFLGRYLDEGRQEREGVVVAEALEGFKRKFDGLPPQTREAVRNFGEWYYGFGEYRGNTGYQLENALAAGLVSEEQFNNIIAARNSDKEILYGGVFCSFEKAVMIPVPVNDRANSDAEFKKYPYTREVWAICP